MIASSNTPTRIAVLMAQGHFYHEHAAYGFDQKLKRLMRSQPIAIEIHKTSSLTFPKMQRLAPKVVSSSPDLLIAIGRFAARSIIAYQTKKKTGIPLLCIGVDDLPDIVNDYMRPLTTGVATETYDLGFFTDLLKYLLFDVKKIVIPYIDNIDLTKLKTKALHLSQKLNHTGIDSLVLPIKNLKNWRSELIERISTSDALLLLEGTILEGKHQQIKQICSTHKVALISESLGYAAKSAALSFGIDPTETGRFAADQAHRILSEKCHITATPFILMNNVRRLVINKAQSLYKGLPIAKHILYLIEFGGIAIGLGKKH